MIKLQAIGHLGRDAEIRNVNGKNVIDFSVAHTEKWKDHTGNQKEKTIWVSCSYWTDKTAIAQYLKKGTQVYVEGEPDVNYYTKDNGEVITIQKCRVFSVHLLGGGQERQPDKQQQQRDATKNYFAPSNNVVSGPATEFNEPVDDLPF